MVLENDKNVYLYGVYTLYFQSNIAPGIMPSIAVAAVPRSPPPPPQTQSDPNMTTTVLNSSMLGRMFATPPMDDPNRSETDTSLIDYENAKGTMPYVLP